MYHRQCSVFLIVLVFDHRLQALGIGGKIRFGYSIVDYLVENLSFLVSSDVVNIRITTRYTIQLEKQLQRGVIF